MTHKGPVTLSDGDLYILGGLALSLLLAMIVGTSRGIRRGPVRALASLVALAAAFLVAKLFGAAAGHAAFSGTHVPWIIRGALGTLLLGVCVWLAVFGYLWWRGRSSNPASGEPENPVTGGFVGCWVAMVWYAVGLMAVLALAGIGDVWADVSGGHAPRPLRWPMRVKAAMSHYRGTAPYAGFDPVPEKQKRLLHKMLEVLRNPKAFWRLQNDEAVRALAANAAFYPLINDPEIRDAVKNQDAGTLMTHPKILQMLADEEFQRRLADTEIEPILDRALSRKTSSNPKPEANP